MIIVYNEAVVENIAPYGANEVLELKGVSEHTNIVTSFRTTQYELGGKYRDNKTREDVMVAAPRTLMAIIPLGHSSVSGRIEATVGNPPQGKISTDNHIIYTDVTPEEFMQVFRDSCSRKWGPSTVLDISPQSLIDRKYRSPPQSQLVAA